MSVIKPDPVLWDTVGNGLKQGSDGCLEPVMFKKEATTAEVRDLTHLYCLDKQCCRYNGKCRCIDAGLQCADFCACDGSDCSNI